VFDWLDDFVLFHDFSLTTLLHILRVAVTLHLRKLDGSTIEALFHPDGEVGDALFQHHETDVHLEQLSKALVALEESKALKFKGCYLALQKENFSESNEFKKVEQTIKFLCSDDLAARLTSYVNYVKEGHIAEKSVEFIDRLMDEDLQENIANNENTDFSGLKSRTDFFLKREQLLQTAQKKRTTKLDVVKEDLIRFLRAEVKTLKRPQSLIMYEEIYIRNAKELENLFNPPLRMRVHLALATPSKYLNCKCCQVKPTELKSSLPPISMAYKLHLECSKMINVYDWLQSYQSVREDTSKLSIAQFLRAVRELTVVGYVKPTTRKTDHCQRLTWGSC